ncbi:MAG TPA: PspA/IM30 family protein [Mesorhizobium sp.]
MLSAISAFVRRRFFVMAAGSAGGQGATMLCQQIHDCTKTIVTARKAIAVATAHDVDQVAHYKRLVASIANLEQRASTAIQQRKTVLAREAAESIARLEAERDTSSRAQAAFHAEIDRLKQVIHAAEARLRELQYGERLLAASERTRRMRWMAPHVGLPILKEAEASLTRLRKGQIEVDASAAIELLEQTQEPIRITDRGANGGASIRNRVDDVMSRLTNRLQATA